MARHEEVDMTLARRDGICFLNTHYAVQGVASAVGNGFTIAYLLGSGFSMSKALLVYAAVLALRLAFRFATLGVVRALGPRCAMAVAVLLGAAQFLPLTHITETWCAILWVVLFAASDAMYWPLYHSAAAVLGSDERSGRQIGMRQAVSAAISVAGPLLGGALMCCYGPGTNFIAAAIIKAAAVLPVLLLPELKVGAIPSLRQSMVVTDRIGFLTFVADGWMTSGWEMTWVAALFLSLGGGYSSFGLANALAGFAGLIAGLASGYLVDRGLRERMVPALSIALALGFVFRALSFWSPGCAAVANATGAAVLGLYGPVVLAGVYGRAKASGHVFRYQFAADAGWDIGASMGCLAAAAIAATGLPPSLATLPGALGVLGVYFCLRGSRPAVLSGARLARLVAGEGMAGMRPSVATRA
jgi:hypothetical protein